MSGTLPCSRVRDWSFDRLEGLGSVVVPGGRSATSEGALSQPAPNRTVQATKLETMKFTLARGRNMLSFFRPQYRKGAEAPSAFHPPKVSITGEAPRPNASS